MDEGWTEGDSLQFLSHSEVVTPSRPEVMAMFSALVPFERDERFVTVELCPGGGELAEQLLMAFPQMTYLGLDGSEVMLNATRARLRSFGDRVELLRFRLEDANWRHELPSQVGAIVSSLAVHHLDGPGKRRLFRDLFEGMAPGGSFLIFDLVLPTSKRAQKVQGDAWDGVVREQAVTLTGTDAIYQSFLSHRENCYHHPDPMDTPDSLFAQLGWLAEAGFSDVDAFWQRAGHALYGGFRPPMAVAR